VRRPRSTSRSATAPLEPVETRYGPALDLRELGANESLAIIARAELRDFIALEQLTPALSARRTHRPCRRQGPGLDLGVLDAFMARVGSIPRAEFELDDRDHEQLLATVDGWRTELERLREQQLPRDRSRRGPNEDIGIDR
jgi:hypothetical protein